MSTEKDREAAEECWKSKCNGSYFIAKAAVENTTKSIALDFFLAGIQHARQGEKERLIGLCEWLLDRQYISMVHEVRTRDALKAEIDEFLEQEAKSGN